MLEGVQTRGRERWWWLTLSVYFLHLSQYIRCMAVSEDVQLEGKNTEQANERSWMGKCDGQNVGAMQAQDERSRGGYARRAV